MAKLSADIQRAAMEGPGRIRPGAKGGRTVRRYAVRAAAAARLAAPRAMAVGVVVGLVFAVREIAAGPYLTYHLWLDVLRIVSRDTLFGAAAAAAAAGLMCAVSLAPRPRGTAGPLPAGLADEIAGMSQALPPLIGVFVAGGAAVMLCTPASAPPLLGLSHWAFVGIGLTLICVVLAVSARGIPVHEAGAPSFVGPVWPTVVALGFLLGLTHLWARAGDSTEAGMVAAAAAVVVLFLYTLLSAPATAAVRWLVGVRFAVGHSVAQRLPLAVLGVAAAVWLVTPPAVIEARRSNLRAGKNVLFISVDSLRYDAVSLLSSDEHERDLTPELRERLAARGTVFTRAYSQAPWTLPSFATMFTGRYPEQHGADRLDGALRASEVTLGEILRRHGYATTAVVSTYFLRRKTGVTQGFAAVDESQAGEGMTISSGEITDRALRFLKTAGDRRFFLFLHYFDAHYPYLRHPEMRQALRTQREPSRAEAKRETAIGSKRAGPRAKEVAATRGRYEDEVAFTDRHIGRLLRYLDERDLWKSTCVILVADHGDEFREHGGIYHSNTLYQEVVHVPLVIAIPGSKLPRVIPEPVETRWLFGTVLQAAGIAPRLDDVSAPSLLSESVRRIGWARSSLARPSAQGAAASTSLTLSSLADRQYHLIRDHTSGRSMLFDIAADPDEQHDLCRERPEVLARLERTLAATDARLAEGRRAGPSGRLSEEDRRRLKALGYL